LLVAEPLAGSSIWLEAYHSNAPRYTSTLSLKGGEIQAAIQISYPQDKSFEAISIMYDGVNGQLANLDLINSAAHIASAQVRVPVTVQGIGSEVDSYASRLKIFIKGMISQGLGIGNGSGNFGRYKIDAITLRAIGHAGTNDAVAFGRFVIIVLRFSAN
jgi:GPI-anchor transamidase subunit GAA1